MRVAYPPPRSVREFALAFSLAFFGYLAMLFLFGKITEGCSISSVPFPFAKTYDKAVLLMCLAALTVTMTPPSGGVWDGFYSGLVLGGSVTAVVSVALPVSLQKGSIAFLSIVPVIVCVILAAAQASPWYETIGTPVEKSRQV